MGTVDPRWSLEAVLRDYDPHPDWRRWFSEAYAQAVESADPAVRLAGWKSAAIIFGDMNTPVFCLFVCHHGRTLEPPGRSRFQAHINLCLWDLGLATPVRPTEYGTVLPDDLHSPDGFQQDAAATEAWFAEQVRPFDGNVERAAVFAMRLTAARFGMLRGPAEPSIAQVLDESLWTRVRS